MVTDAQGKPTSEILPAKFSPDDKFGSYRRIARKQLEQ
jgi:rRNA maturation protein Nop10